MELLGWFGVATFGVKNILGIFLVILLDTNKIGTDIFGGTGIDIVFIINIFL